MSGAGGISVGARVFNSNSCSSAIPFYLYPHPHPPSLLCLHREVSFLRLDSSDQFDFFLHVDPDVP
jgi:hypothetical protein